MKRKGGRYPAALFFAPETGGRNRQPAWPGEGVGLREGRRIEPRLPGQLGQGAFARRPGLGRRVAFAGVHRRHPEMRRVRRLGEVGLPDERGERENEHIGGRRRFPRRENEVFHTT